MRLGLPLALAWLAGAAHAQTPPPQPSVDPKDYPVLTAMLATLQNGSEASRYCAQTGGLYLEADALLRQKKGEREVVDALVARGKNNLAPAELKRLRELATAATSLAVGFQALAPESSAVAYTQTCLASTRQAPGTRSQQELNERFADALACDRKFTAGSLEGKECVARAFRYR
jgi:hypothetical protein